jgi:hypothetical protein
MFRIRLAAFAFAFCLIAPAGARGTHSDLNTGSDVLPVCRDAVNALDRGRSLNWEELANGSACGGFIVGVDQTVTFYCPGPMPIYCIPNNVEVGQLARAFTKYLTKHPERLHEVAAFLFIEAMIEAFPCRRP